MSILYGVWHTKGRLRGGLFLPDSRAVVLQQCGQSRWAGGIKGRLIRAQTTRRIRISCQDQLSFLRGPLFGLPPLPDLAPIFSPYSLLLTGALQLLINRFGQTRFAPVHERVSTKNCVVISIGNSESNHLGGQGTFNPTYLISSPSTFSDLLSLLSSTCSHLPAAQTSGVGLL